MTVATVLFLSGPNLNLFGQREPDVYGTTTLDEMVAVARETLAKYGHDLEHVQSNHEGVLIDAVQGARGRCAALVVNAGALTHYSYALADALATYDGVAVELHVSNPNAREAFRRVSVVAPVVTGTIAGFGADGYRLAADAVAALLEKRSS
jgi:3-dehydroquinate dehydratase-2